MAEDLPHHLKTYESIGRIMVRWSSVESSVDTLLALTGADRKGPFKQKVGRLAAVLADNAGIEQPYSFEVLASAALGLAPRRNVVAHWTITRMDGRVVTYVNPEVFPLTQREDHTDSTLADLSDAIGELALQLQGYLARYHSALMVPLALDEGFQSVGCPELTEFIGLR